MAGNIKNEVLVKNAGDSDDKAWKEVWSDSYKYDESDCKEIIDNWNKTSKEKREFVKLLSSVELPEELEEDDNIFSECPNCGQNSWDGTYCSECEYEEEEEYDD